MTHCSTCRHGLPTKTRPGMDLDYRHCDLRPLGLPPQAWIGVRCHWTPPKWEPRHVPAQTPPR